MPQNLLTDAKVRHAKSGSTAYKLSDGGGLFLLVRPTATALECSTIACLIAGARTRWKATKREIGARTPCPASERSWSTSRRIASDVVALRLVHLWPHPRSPDYRLNPPCRAAKVRRSPNCVRLASADQQGLECLWSES